MCFSTRDTMLKVFREKQVDEKDIEIIAKHFYGDVNHRQKLWREIKKLNIDLLGAAQGEQLFRLARALEK